MMRTSHTLTALVGRLRAAGLSAEADLLEAEAARVRGVEAALDAVLDGLAEAGTMAAGGIAAGFRAEPIAFPARRVPGMRQHREMMAQAAD